MRTEPARLREWFEGRAVVVGDRRDPQDVHTSKDVHTYADGRRIPGYVAHATGLESLIRCFAFTTTVPVSLAFTACTAAIGLWAAMRRGPRIGLGLAAFGAAAALAAPVALLHLAAVLVDPVSGLAAMLAALWLGTWLGVRHAG
jgi:CHASE2 domain-containing sensor protein